MEEEVMKNKKNENVNINKGEIVIYRHKDGKSGLEVKLERETVWLSLNQMVRLFHRDKSVISRHISNVFQEKELDTRSTVAKFATVQMEGIRRIERLIECYNLDVIISVGYRVKSKSGTQFRIWAAKVLKDYLVRGYALNQKRLIEKEGALKDLQDTIKFISGKAVHPQLIGKSDGLLKLLNEYANALTILHEYDNKLLSISARKTPTFILAYEHAQEVIGDIKSRLREKGEATELLGQEASHKFKSIIGALYQTFDRKDLYRSIEEKAANLLYLTIKDHPFSDGNKRIASIMFIYFLDKNRYLCKANGERKITDNTMVALSLLIAASDPREKDTMIKIITNLLKEG